MAGSAIDTALIFQAITLPSIRLEGKSPPRYSAGLSSGTNSLFDIAHTEASSVFFPRFAFIEKKTVWSVQ